ncbi:hypothetical protein Mal64_33620 [Pseudobythopirellula maris]|uniref:Uncharacterized protein n=1 Tax=Pseudobythopirellula maris TaxID=2527991 RepID=A0A5C5ZH39_9BACT|nr:hypothetical protein [Pseudobythopirellula maris]TWT86536.1 hypothetical protein Mal64_33620 [Pseudobythopirellula maris]
MARVYAGVLGFLAAAVTLARGVFAGSGLEGTATDALLAMAALAAVGAVVGQIAETTVDESVRWRLEKQLAEADLLAAPSDSDPKA